MYGFRVGVVLVLVLHRILDGSVSVLYVDVGVGVGVGAVDIDASADILGVELLFFFCRSLTCFFFWKYSIFDVPGVCGSIRM